MSTQNFRVLVKQDLQPVTVTGYTATVLIPSGATATELVSGNTWIIYSNPTGATAAWGLITGTITDQTDLINYISGQTSGLTSSWSGLTGLPADNSDLVDYVAQEISGATSGLTSSWSGLTGLPADNSDLTDLLLGYTLTGTTQALESAFNSHSGDTTIHFTMDVVNTAISAATSGLTSSWSGLTGMPTDNSDLVDYVTGETSQYLKKYEESGTMSVELQNIGYQFQANVKQGGVSTGGQMYLTSARTHLLGVGAGQVNNFSIWNTYSDSDKRIDYINPSGFTFNDNTLIHRSFADGRYTLTGTTQALESAFDSHSGDTSIHYPMSGISITESQISDFGNYALESELTGLTSSYNSHTGDTSIHYAQSAITITESQISDLGDYALESDLTGLTSSYNSHTGDTTIHYPMSGISITESQISDFGDYTLTGTTAALQSSFDSHTGDTTIHFTKSSININDLGDVVTTTPADNDTLKYSGTTWVNEAPLDIFVNVNDLEYLRRNGTAITGTTTIDVLANVTDGQLLARNGTDITGVTQSFAQQSDLTGHTGNTAIHFEMGDITGFTTTSDFNTFTGTTAPQTYAPLIASIVSYSASTTGTSAWSGKIVEVDSSGATTITLPSGMTTGMKVSIVNVNTGDVTIASQGTLQGVGTILATQYTKAEAYHRGSDVWLITGTLT